MVNNQEIPLSIQPIIRYPREAEVNKKYLMEIDIKQTDNLEKWLYEEEEYPIYCRVDTYSKESTTPLFKIQPIGKPAIVLHRFGGTYGPAKFLLTAASKDIKGEIRITLVNGWGVALKMLRLRDVSITKEKTENTENTSKESITISKTSKLETFDFESEVDTVFFENETNESSKKLKTILLVEDKPGIIEEISELLSSSYGINVKGTDNVNEIIEQVVSHKIDLILINENLPKSSYKEENVDGIDLTNILREDLKISVYLPIVGFSSHKFAERYFLSAADGFYYKGKVLQKAKKTDFINYIRKVFNRVKVTEIMPYELKYDLDSVLDLMNKQDSEDLETSEEEVASLLGKPKKDDGTYYLLENLCLLRILDRASKNEVEPGTVKYRLSNLYVNQESPITPSLPTIEEFEIRIQKLYQGQRKLLKEIEKRNKQQQTTSQADVAVFFPHPQGGNIATYRRLENLRLLGFLTIVEIGTNQETIRYDLSHQYLQYLTLKTSNNSNSSHEVDLKSFQFETPTVNPRGEIIKTTTYTASYFTEKLSYDIDLEMVAIPSGTFTMGSPESEKESYSNERPQHNVTLSSFFMGKYPITQAQWKAIASRTDLKVNIKLKEDPSHFKGDNRPVEKVNWYETVEFCQRLSKLTGRDYHLPSEAQWEYACRAMIEPLNLEKGQSYPPFYFGETITGELANYDASNTYADEPKGKFGEETIPVAQFPPNAFGLYDMHGNVWEWCADDWHDNYEDAPTDGSAWVDDEPSDNFTDKNMEYLTKKDDNDSTSVLRGGSWYYDPNYCRSAIRGFLNRREFRLNYYGFRVVYVFRRTE
ncbi:MAG: SUMF1/EgtB/PvdO family nonheme iron enzyme [Crocosphaera sp.]|nr:SUMF1/EgtB/PvdO family nonheme iron enzyme [Crocosphaera sp.]